MNWCFDMSKAPRDGTWFIIGFFARADNETRFEVGRYNPLMVEKYTLVQDGLYKKETESAYDWDGFNNFYSADAWAAIQQPPIEEAGE